MAEQTLKAYLTGLTVFSGAIDYTNDKFLIYDQSANALKQISPESIFPADPNADKILFWDDSAGTIKWLTLGTNLSITDTTIDASGGGGGDIATTSVAVGSSALSSGSPVDSVAVGNNAGARCDSQEDVFIGKYAGRGAVASTSIDNVGIGNEALEAITNAAENVAVGAFAGFRITTGGDNTLIGYEAGFNLDTGSNNVCIGKNAGLQFDLTSGSGNVFIGAGAGSFGSFSNPSDRLLIDSTQTGEGALIYGEFDNRLLRINGWLLSKTKVAAKTADYTLTTDDSGGTFTNEGTTAKHVFTLPSAAVGLHFTFIVQDSDGLRVTANTGDTIRLAATVSASAGFTESTTIGNVVRLEAINNTEWIATSIVGTWTTT